MRILVNIASYGNRNDEYLWRLVREYRSMHHTVDIEVLSNLQKDGNGEFQVRVGLPNKNPWSLPFGHKQIFADQVDAYDLFIYSEDDILITERNLSSFQEVTKVLEEDEIAGFLRSETATDGTRYFCDAHGPYHWDPASLTRRGNYQLAFFTNEHAACYVLTRSQLRRAIRSGGFLVGPHEGRYDLLCTAATDPYTQCGMRKLIPVSHLDEFVVPHLPNKYIGKMGLVESRFREQIHTLEENGKNGVVPYSLFNTETRLRGLDYSKNYYESVLPELLPAIPGNARTILSIGCGWGALEELLAKKGKRVIAVPLDPVIGGGMEKQGIKVLHGGFEAVRQQLEGERVDCLLMSNVLQFVRDPSETLASFAGLLDPNAVAIAVVPNFMRPLNLKKSLMGVSLYEGFGGYEATAVHPTSRPMIRKWFKEVGLNLDRVINVLSGKGEEAARMMLGMADAFFATQFIAVARKG